MLRTMAGMNSIQTWSRFPELVEGQVKMRICKGWDPETRARSTIMREALRAVLG